MWRRQRLKGDNKTQQLNLGKSSQERFVFINKIEPKVKNRENHIWRRQRLKGDNKTQQLNLGKSSQERFGFMDNIKP
jgi:hypothetical protein